MKINIHTENLKKKQSLSGDKLQITEHSVKK